MPDRMIVISHTVQLPIDAPGLITPHGPVLVTLSQWSDETWTASMPIINAEAKSENADRALQMLAILIAQVAMFPRSRPDRHMSWGECMLLKLVHPKPEPYDDRGTCGGR